MPTFTIGRWLLVVIAIAGLAFAAPAVSAHGNETTADDARPYDGTTADWVAWMEAHATDHVGPGGVEWMEAHTGVTVDEMAREMAEGGHHDERFGTTDGGRHDSRYGTTDGNYHDGRYGQGRERGC